MLSINWHGIRPINGDQREGFEEFITQIARKENIPNAKQFIRKGKPDAGVECFWILNDDTEWAWQAKYFTSFFNTTQWKQIDESVETAIEKHPKMIKYIIAMPIDPPDARLKGKESLLKKWDNHLTKWIELAKARSQNIEFVPWWSSDLITRLQLPENAGMSLFWFDTASFTDDWFIKKTEQAIADLGSRYSPELNVELDIAKIFDGIARDDNFFKLSHDKFDELLMALQKVQSRVENNELSMYLKKLNGCISNFHEEYKNIKLIGDDIYDFGILIKLQETTIEVLSDILKCTSVISIDNQNRESIDFLKYNIRNAQSAVDEFRNFTNSIIVSLFNNPFLLLSGEAGIGKSHLLADVVKKRNHENKYSILLLGQHFNKDEPPSKQILNQFGLNCDFDDFLEALNSKAQTSGSRLILFIDAINEGGGKHLWVNYINGFIKNISKYRWLGVVLSIRSSYLPLFKDNIKTLSGLVYQYKHVGFYDVEYAASKFFFKNFNIELPQIPFLHPEFKNPLFLKLFCEGLQKSGYTKIPDGFSGITTIFNFFIDGINIKLQRDFDFPMGINIVNQIIQRLIKYELEQNEHRIPLDIAVCIISEFQSTYHVVDKSTNNLTDALISEGIISKNSFWKEKGQYEEYIYIAYERFEDHIIASSILDKISVDNITSETIEKGRLFKYLKDRQSINMNKGIIDALSIQLPEKYKIELFEIVKDNESACEIADSFVNSLIWRKENKIFRQEVLDYVYTVVLKFEGTRDAFFDTVIALSGNPKQYFNADWLHKILINTSLAHRDAWWTIFINRINSDNSSIERLIDWAWSLDDNNYITDESVELSATMLSWFLTSTNRKLRDATTKSLVCLLQNRLPVVINILKRFKNVNDPYVYERLFAVAYGCTLRTSQKNSIKDLSECIYKTIFDKEKVYPHVLLRDYARNVIEYALSLGLEMNIDVAKIRPPYKSDFPIIPSDEEIGNYKIDYNNPGYSKGINSILQSMEVEYTRDGKVANYGDFGRYVFQLAFSNWDNLSPVDLKNIAIQRIFDLGYDKQKHDIFDSNLPYNGRSPPTIERIGKKYQWVAMHELMAQVADNYKMHDPSANWQGKKYIFFEGPWEPYVRDFDPTIINKIDVSAIITLNENFNYTYEGVSNEEWIKDTSNLPNPSKIIEDASGEWISLARFLILKEERPLGEENYIKPQKEFWYMIKSYLVEAKRYENIVNWLSSKNFYGRWMPESHERYELFNREFYWSPAFRFFQNDYYCGREDNIIYDRENDKNIGEVIVSDITYHCGSDFVQENSLSILKPCLTLTKSLHLEYRNNESYMYSNSGELICFDSSEGFDNVQQCLYFKKTILQDFLKRSGYKLIWTVLAEKTVLGNISMDNPSPRIILSGVYTLDDDNIVGKLNRYE
jgi:hypothetical protein